MGRDTMRAVRLHRPEGAGGLEIDEIAVPPLRATDVLVRVHAAAITRDELEWPLDRLPAIPSYEVSGVVEAVGADVSELSLGEDVFALTPFDRDGCAAELAVIPAHTLAPKPGTLGHVESAALPLAGLSAWQGLFDHGRLQAGQRVMIHGAAGGVGQFATQLARECGAYVIGTASADGLERVRELGADQAIDRLARFEELLEPVDLVFDTVGGDVLARSLGVLREGGKLVSVAEEPPDVAGSSVTASYFVVEPRRDQLVELARLADAGELVPAVDSVFPLASAREAFERVQASGKRGKVILELR